jgi:hypothetical protein
MIIITSASYIDQEFSSEFGLIPPAFLPVGNRRLYTWQARCLPDSERRVLTVPESFTLSDFDSARLAELGIEVLHIPEGLSLGESVVCAINLAGNRPDAPLRILHGDTLIGDLPGEALDIVTLSEVDGAYNWAAWHEGEDPRVTPLDENRMVGRVPIANGYFAFADCGLFVRSVIHSSGNFVQGLNAYSRERPLAGVDVERWYDFGHGHTFYRSKARMTTQRAFNNLEIDPEIVRKTSGDAAKMEAEYHWYDSLPGELRIHTPQLVGRLNDPDPGYQLQYLYLASLSEVYVFGQLPRFVWREVFRSCIAFLRTCAEHAPTEPVPLAPGALFYDKTAQRLERWRAEAGVDLDAPWSIDGLDVPSIAEIARRTAAMIPDLDPASLCVVHGDFCFSNILYDFRAQAIKVIDPRGCLPDGTVSIYGDPRYDIAKLAHSVIGLYDFIVAGDCAVERDGQALSLRLPAGASIADVQALFVDMIGEAFGLDRKVLIAMQVHLFLSMIPLHADAPQRQSAFLANALRLYAEIG